jgi:hypothetical protein
MIYASKKEFDTLLETIKEDELGVDSMEEGDQESTILHHRVNRFTYLDYMMVWGVCAILIGLIIFIFVYYKVT